MDETILDELIPIPSLEELKEQEIAALQAAGFVITKFTSGGVFNMLLMIVLQIYLELLGLLRGVLGNMFLAHATGAWLDLKAMDYSKQRKQAQKTHGILILKRQGATGDAVRLAKGHVFKTEKDINGEELRFLATQETVLQKDASSVFVPVEAEQAGGRYNVPPGQITRTLIHLPGVESITNQANWLQREGSDTEDDEGLRKRALRAWSELARVPIRDTYLNACEAVPGVLYVTVDDNHPRGQGSIDIIVTSTAGAASKQLLDAVTTACDSIRAPDDNVLVKGSQTVRQPIALTVTLPAAMDDTGIGDKVVAAITHLMGIGKGRTLNQLTHADLIFCVKRDVPAVGNVTITMPATDLLLETEKVILPGTITVTIQGV